MGVGRTATLSGKFKGKNIEIYLSNTNTSWSDMNGDKLVVDSEVDIDDEYKKTATNDKPIAIS